MNDQQKTQMRVNRIKAICRLERELRTRRGENLLNPSLNSYRFKIAARWMAIYFPKEHAQ